MRIQKKTFLIFILLSFFLFGCAQVPYTGREQFMIISNAEEMKLGETAFAQIKKESNLSQDPQSNALLRKVGARIAAAVDRPDYHWEFMIIDKDVINAFALPGGKVTFYTGILPVCKDEAGVAVVMGHEVAHVLARHGAERLSQEKAFAAGQTALQAAVSAASPIAQEAVLGAYGLGAKVGVLLPYSRTHESEADKIGLILMAKAGYDPSEAVAFWKRMDERFKGKEPPQFLATHPSDAKRISDIEAFLPTAMEYYKPKQ